MQEHSKPSHKSKTADSLLLVTGLWASLQNPSASAPSASLSLPTVEKSDHDNGDDLLEIVFLV